MRMRMRMTAVGVAGKLYWTDKRRLPFFPPLLLSHLAFVASLLPSFLSFSLFCLLPLLPPGKFNIKKGGGGK